MIKPTKIAGSFVLFGGGSVEAANVTLYSAFSATPKTYDERKALPPGRRMTLLPWVH